MQKHSRDLFETSLPDTGNEPLAPGAWLLHGFALGHAAALAAAVEHITAAAPFRHLVTPGGFRMSVAMTNCGGLGWVSDRHGYRYDARDPLNGRPWPPMPPVFLEVARTAAQAGGFPGFSPDACLLNRYEPCALPKNRRPARPARRRADPNRSQCSRALRTPCCRPRRGWLSRASRRSTTRHHAVAGRNCANRTCLGNRGTRAWAESTAA